MYPCHVLCAGLAMRDGAFSEVMWKDVRVGDVLKIQRNAAVPADCVFLASHSQDTNQPDTCYVQTAQLDGETNLKLRQALPATVARFKTDSDVATFRGYVRCEAPNASFDKFVGTISLNPVHPGHGGMSVASAVRVEALRAGSSPGSNSGGSAGSVASNPMARMSAGSPSEPLTARSDNSDAAINIPDRPLPLEAEQTLLRGSIIRNVDFVYGLVVYTGRETKVRVKQTTALQKRAQVETEINRMIVLLLLVLIGFCVAGAIGGGIWVDDHWRSHSYLGFTSGFSPLDGVRQFFTFFLLNASFIPVSLYVTVRLARSFQMWFMEKDREMFHEEPELLRATNGLEGQYPFKVRMMDLNDELGQITHVFSDKTGALPNYIW